MLLEVKGLRVSLGSSEILKNVSFKVEKGEVVGLLGPNGSGKSTLLRTIFGVLKPLGGVVYFNGKNLAELERKDVAKLLGYLPQEASDTGLKVKEVVMLGRTPYIHGISFKEGDLTAVREALRLVGLSDFEERRFFELSGGEKQKVMLARVFAQHTDVLLLDEPTAHLDISSQLEIMGLIRSRVREGCSALLAIHDINLASAYCDRLLLIKRGEIFAAGKPEEVITRENIREVYGADVEVRRIGGNILVIPSRKRESEKEKWVHVICGGGSGTELIRELWLHGYKVSAGVLNALDSDWFAASEIGEVIDEQPFSEISDDAFVKNLEFIEKADIVILSNLTVGKGNLRNLEAALYAAKLGKLLVVEEEEFEKRNFAGSEAAEIYNEISSSVPQSKVFKKSHELIKSLRTSS
ncbi:MAG: ABC transporter ATP-binding protein [Archaeoglobus sp.]|nr:ABC transporter ATP-binding protein [Archaeoglobus sp.]